MKILLIIIAMLANQFNDYRKIILFAPAADHPDLKAQKQILDKDPEGIKERNLKIEVVLYDAKNARLFKKYKVAYKSFAFILIGKDGGEKLRSTETVSLEKLYSTIDAMPMRRSEMKTGKQE